MSVENRRVAIGPRNLVLRTESRCGGLDLLEKAKTLGKTKNAERGDSRRGHTRLVREAGLHLIGVFIIAVSVCELRNRR